jgi:type IV pilus assembly protein PilE
MQMTHPHRAAGFTLVELIVAMVILATLAAIAIPSYKNYVLKSHRAEAKSALLDLASLEERYFSANNNYTATPTDLGYPGASAPFYIGSGSYYQVVQIGLVNATPPSGTSTGSPATFYITANAVGNQQSDTACASFTVNSAGQQSATGTDPNASVDCWQN